MRRRGQYGFTLVELLIVVVVLGLLAAIVTFAVGQATSDSRASACGADLRTIDRALESFRVAHGDYPASLLELTAANEHLRGDGSITASQKVGSGYTVSYDGMGGLQCTTGTTPVPPGGGAATMSATVTAAPATFTGNGANRVWSVVMTTTVTDNGGGAVPGAAVVGAWAFSFDGNNQHRGVGSSATSCTTGAAGTCTLAATSMESNVASATLSLSSVTKTGLTWSHPLPVAGSRDRPF